MGTRKNVYWLARILPSGVTEYTDRGTGQRYYLRPVGDGYHVTHNGRVITEEPLPGEQALALIQYG